MVKRFLIVIIVFYMSDSSSMIVAQCKTCKKGSRVSKARPKRKERKKHYGVRHEVAQLSLKVDSMQTTLQHITQLLSHNGA